MENNKKMLIFDLDGTLVDTIYDVSESVNKSLTSCGLKEKTIEEYRSYAGNGLNYLISHAIGINNYSDSVFETVLNNYRKTYSENCFKNSKVYFNIKEILIKLLDKGYLLAVISNKYDYETKKIIHHFFEGMFIYITGSKDSVNKKPQTDAMDIMLKELNLEVENVIYIGDSHIDAEFANNCGCDYILVTYGEEHIETLKKFKPLAFINYPEELLKYL